MRGIYEVFIVNKPGVLCWLLKTDEENRYYKGVNLAALLSMTYDEANKSMTGSLELTFCQEKEISA